MKPIRAYFILVLVAAWPHVASAQSKPWSVCQVLNSASDHQTVSIHAALALTRHQSYVFEGTGRDPCPGWPKRFLTAPAAIPLFLGKYAGVPVSDQLVHDFLDFSQKLRTLESANPSARHMVTITGVLIRKRWPLIFRSGDGTYVGWGEGLDGGSAAILVVTSIPIEDR